MKTQPNAADLLAIAANDDHVRAVLHLVDEHSLPLFVLGGGSNLLVGDGGVRGDCARD